MRKKLGKIMGKRMEFRATVERFGSKTAFRGPDLLTILLKNVIRVDTGEVVCDHLWFVAGKCWSNMSAGDEVKFEARVGTYEKGYKGRREDVFQPVTMDYRLERPTKVTKVVQGGHRIEEVCVEKPKKNSTNKVIK